MSKSLYAFLLMAALAVAFVGPASAGGAAPAPVVPPAKPASTKKGAKPDIHHMTRAQIEAELDAYWQHARREVDRNALELIAQHQAEQLHGITYHKLLRGDPTRKQIALTFDDGPHPAFTPQILALLEKEKIHATFFLVGEMAEQYPNLVRAEVKDGNEIGNHTYHHVNLTKIPETDAAVEIKACGEVLQSITGRAPHLFRPPGGDYDSSVARTSDALGYTMVLWTDDPGDFASPGARVIAQRIQDQISNGGIILIHDGIQQTIDILPSLIQNLKKKGYEFVTIDELMKQRTAYNTSCRRLARAMQPVPVVSVVR